MIARVSLEIALRREFDYAIPAELSGQVDVGSRVQVPFGARKVLGVVTAVAEESGQVNLKSIIKIIGAQTLVTAKVLRLARWIGVGNRPKQCTKAHGNARLTTGDTPVTLGITEQRNRGNAMAAKIKSELAVGVTEEIKSALVVATEFQGTTPSQYGRQAILEKLCREGFLRHPMHKAWQTPEAGE